MCYYIDKERKVNSNEKLSKRLQKLKVKIGFEHFATKHDGVGKIRNPDNSKIEYADFVKRLI